MDDSRKGRLPTALEKGPLLFVLVLDEVANYTPKNPDLKWRAWRLILRKLLSLRVIFSADERREISRALWGFFPANDVASGEETEQGSCSTTFAGAERQRATTAYSRPGNNTTSSGD
jgi:hypothetical protein